MDMKRTTDVPLRDSTLPAGYPEFIAELKRQNPLCPRESSNFRQPRVDLSLLADWE
ncbi:MAG: hypothetical protein STSR0009_09600 [Methanoregula sp.]